MRRLILASNAVFVVPNSMRCAACGHPAAAEREPVNSHDPPETVVQHNMKATSMTANTLRYLVALTPDRGHCGDRSRRLRQQQ